MEVQRRASFLRSRINRRLAKARANFALICHIFWHDKGIRKGQRRGWLRLNDQHFGIRYMEMPGVANYKPVRLKMNNVAK